MVQTCSSFSAPAERNLDDDVAIADNFLQNNIRYLYEYDAMNRRNNRRISWPDFYLPDYGIYVGYWGVLGAEDSRVRSRYKRSMRWKMARYHQNTSSSSASTRTTWATWTGSFGQSSGKLPGTTFSRR
jgi:hypothetical protein